MSKTELTPFQTTLTPQPNQLPFSTSLSSSMVPQLSQLLRRGSLVTSASLSPSAIKVLKSLLMETKSGNDLQNWKKKKSATTKAKQLKKK